MDLQSFHSLIEQNYSAREKTPGTTTIAVMAGKKLLMGKRRDNGKWTLPGGGLNEGELPIVGAMREMREETGVIAPSLDYLGCETVEGRSGRRVTVHCFCLYAGEKMATQTLQDPDQEVLAWDWIDTSGGLPAEVKSNLQSPRNLLLIRLGLL